MILVMEAGGTKTEAKGWKEGKMTTVSGPGINPNFLSDDEIEKRISYFNVMDLKSTGRSYLYYYGAGCQNDYQKNRIKQALSIWFPEFHIEVEHDLQAAARALCGKKAGFAGILGTGSNGCFFDGQKIEKQMISLGFWLGDEGSGGYLGKLLVTNWLKGKMPADLEKEFEKMVPWPKEMALSTIYADPNVNSSLASLARFCFENRENPWIENLIDENLKAYFNQLEDVLEGKNDIQMNFTGSVAFLLKDDLLRHVKRMGQNLGTIIANPSEALLQYHIEGK